MFGVDSSELLIVAVLALIFIGPKELPATLRTVGQWVGRIRAHARHFTSGIENIMREAELEEMEKRWREENERIMQQYPMGALPYAGANLPPTDEPVPIADVMPPAGPVTDPDEPGLPLPAPDHARRPLP
ncbi:Sec-independent protein translocase protein TatB [Sphingomonas sp. BN140010]|uniref:Sec-independent protein translocase protein TatB n=1 Tax=Sphingomonas arvum TaxID=2992113 RepID=A0ABT3JGZ9_9SPHN|nr:Sec-independent protein translocase protein TatB [Sphingomonas sp. BN140010]MCW3798350.1 Sec-independent protein translocase protein TatB [Sphingomonas sp. BN140010]